VAAATAPVTDAGLQTTVAHHSTTIDQGVLSMATKASTALITGGTSGIGRAVAQKLAQLGIHVLVVGRHAERGAQTVADIRAAGGAADFLVLSQSSIFGQNPKIWCREFNGLQTPKLSKKQLCDRTQQGASAWCA